MFRIDVKHLTFGRGDDTVEHTHIMKSGILCGRVDGHAGQCSSPSAWATLQAGRRKWKTEHPDNSAAEYRSIRTRAVALYGDSCACCGKTENLQIDHIYGGGKAHKRTFGGSTNFYYWLVRNHPAGFQLLCAQCNQSKYTGDACRIDHLTD